MNNLHERDLNLPLEWARERNHSSLKSVTRFGLVYLRVSHSFGNNAQGWKMFGKIFTQESEIIREWKRHPISDYSMATI